MNLYQRICFIACLFLLPLSMSHAQEVLDGRDMGGTNDDLLTRVVSDAAGNAYVMGTFTGSLDLGNGLPVLTTATGVEDSYIASFDADGIARWVVQLSSSEGSTLPSALTLNESQGLLLTGGRYLGTLSIGTGGENLSGDIDFEQGYIIALSLNDGSVGLHIPVLEGSFDAEVRELRLSDAGSIYMVGNFLGTAVLGYNDINDPANTAFVLTGTGGGTGAVYDVAIGSYGADGTLFWGMLGSGSTSGSIGVGIDYYNDGIDEYIYATGQFTGTVNFQDEQGGSFNATTVGGSDIFLLRAAAGSGAIDWLVSDGSTLDDEAYDLVVDNLGDAYITGTQLAASTFSPDESSGVITTIGYGLSDAVFAKYNTVGQVIWARSAGGIADDFGTAIELNAEQEPFLAGAFQSTAMSFAPATAGEDLLTLSGASLLRLRTAASCGAVRQKARPTKGLPGSRSAAREAIWQAPSTSLPPSPAGLA